MNSQKILVENGFVAIPQSNKKVPQTWLATILSNIAHYGYALNETAYTQLTMAEDVEAWWAELETVLKSLTGDDKNMGDFVVYKNFPREVMEMSEAEYWVKQILMYWGFANEYFTEDEDDRELVQEKLPCKVLQASNDNTYNEIFVSLLRSPVKWTERQNATVEELMDTVSVALDLSAMSFKENMVSLALMLDGRDVPLGSATDVIRLAAGMSNGDISLRTKTKFCNFKRKDRRFLMRLLEGCKNLDEDVSRRREEFKRLFFALRPGDYRNQYPRVVDAYNKAYRGTKVETFNSKLERLLAANDRKALKLLKSRPGEFLRRLRVALNKYGLEAAAAFQSVMPRLTVHQLLKIEKQLTTANDRVYRAFPPKGNWTKLQVVEATKKDRWNSNLAGELAVVVADEIGRRVGETIPSVNMSADLAKVKLQGNDADLTPYGRGTVFDIPENITFLRSASYWKTGGKSYYRNIWFDNGWNFFDDDWKPLGVCCWTDVKFDKKAAVFSGDPTNSKDLEGRACQMVDLYLDRLEQSGVRYAVWNILCYSRLSFDESEEVQAALQWGEHPEKNKLFEPSRCVFSFPLKGSNMTKYIAYVDVAERKLVYMDANLYGNVDSANSNGTTLSEKMPAFVEYLNSLPSVYDLFKSVERSEDGMPIVYDDTDEPVVDDEAYVFLRQNKKSEFNPVDVNKLLK